MNMFRRKGRSIIRNYTSTKKSNNKNHNENSKVAFLVFVYRNLSPFTFLRRHPSPECRACVATKRKTSKVRAYFISFRSAVAAFPLSPAVFNKISYCFTIRGFSFFNLLCCRGGVGRRCATSNLTKV